MGKAEDLLSNWNLFWKETNCIHMPKLVHSPNNLNGNFLQTKMKGSYVLKLFIINSGPKVRYVEEILEAKILGN